MLNSTCLWPECDRAAFARGLCQRCHMRARRAGNVATFRSPDPHCRYCGESYQEGTRSGKWFCSAECRQAARKQSRALRRIELLGERTCTYCLEPMSIAVRADAKFCSIRCQQAEWYTANNERVRQAANDWRRKHPDKRAEHTGRRSALKRSATAERIDIDAVWDRDCGCCWICTKMVDRTLRYPHPLSRSLDHVIPLAKGGPHAFSNVATAHLRCNISKKDKLLPYLPHWFLSEGEEEPGVVAKSA